MEIRLACCIGGQRRILRSTEVLRHISLVLPRGMSDDTIVMGLLFSDGHSFFRNHLMKIIVLLTTSRVRIMILAPFMVIDIKILGRETYRWMGLSSCDTEFSPTILTTTKANPRCLQHISGERVGITGLEPATSSSRTTCATNCAKIPISAAKGTLNNG